MQVLAVSIFNFITVIYSIAQIFQTRAFYNCLSDVDTIIKSSPNLIADLFKLESQSGCYFSIVAVAQSGFPFPLSNPATTNIAIQQNLNFFASVFKYQMAVMVFMIIFNGIGFFVAYKVYLEYGWNNFLEQGASVHKRKMNIRYQLFIILIKLNIFVNIIIFNCSLLLACLHSTWLQFTMPPKSQPLI